MGFSNWPAPWYLGRGVRRRARSHEHHELLALAAPRPLLVVGGNASDGDRSWPYIDAALGVYRLHGDHPPFGLLNHRQGHSVPAEAEKCMYQWLEAYI